MDPFAQHKARYRPLERGDISRGAFDVVVLGAGIGGLSAAIAAAQAGASCLVVEQHVVPGGCCSAFRRRGYTFDAAVHNVAGAGRFSSYGQLLRRLGLEAVAAEMMLPYPDNGTVLVGDDRFTYPALVPELRAALQQRYPHESDGIASYLRQFQRLYRSAWRGAEKDQAALGGLRGRSIDGLMRDHIKDAGCRFWLSGMWPYLAVPPDQLGALEAILTFGSYMLQGTYYPKGGTQALANAYVERLEALGGVLALRTSAQGIQLQSDGTKIIQLSHGGAITTRRLIAAIAPQQLLSLLDEPSQMPALAAAVQAATPSPSAYLAYLGLTPEADLTGLPWGFVFEDRSWDPDGWLFLSRPASQDPSLAPEGHQILCVMAGYTGPFLSRAEAKPHKEAFAARLLQRLGRYAPAIAEHVEVMEIGSPATIERYTLNPQGHVYGWASLASQSGPQRLAQTTEIDGLVLAGHWTRPGSGVPAVTLSGIQAAALLLEGA